MATETESVGEGIGDAVGVSPDAAGLPQLDVTTFSNHIFWLVVTLVAIYIILSKVALPRIASVLAERQGTITNDLAAAEDLKAKALEAEEAYNKALAEARAEANRIAAETKAEMQVEIDEAMAKADAEIAARTAESEARIAEISDGAAAAIKTVAKDTATAVVAALGVDVDAASIDAAIAARTKA
ncbi:MAG: F0F1 ATP synthase subunit B' [Pseudomonadota bacterium]